ncbi:hypothetical protein JXC34_05650 [Candidatus Woesearchaeota archaeon]|nr:hypothetical protein [Candidatus Woesearchaeota archaeon]
MQKKSELTTKTLVEIIVFVLVLILFLIPLISKLATLAFGEQREVSYNTMQRIANTLRDIDDEDTIPVYVDKNSMIAGFNISSQFKPSECNEELSCICVCKKEGCDEKNVLDCIDFDVVIDKKKLMIEDFAITSTADTANYRFTLNEGKVTVEEVKVAVT